MNYNPFLNKISKPLYKASIFFIRIGMIAALIGLILGLFWKVWLILFLGLGCTITSLIVGNLPTHYLTSLLKAYDESLTAKEATNIAQKHLRESKESGTDTTIFVMDIIDGVERKKRKE